MKENFFEVLIANQQKQEITKVLECNDKSSRFGLILSEEEAKGLIVSRRDTLKEQRRVEFGGGILPNLIDAFCDSEFMQQDTYAETLTELQELFYLYKNESRDLMTDDELMAVMRELYDTVCFGSVEYLADTCLERFARAVRAGYEGYQNGPEDGGYSQLSEEERWDHSLYQETLWELLGAI